MTANTEDNGVYNLGSSTASSGQTSMFGDPAAVAAEEVTTMHIDLPDATTVGASTGVHSDDTEVSTGMKAKVLASLAIVAVAGYIAYWVQEPVQLQADVLQGNQVAAVENSPATLESAPTAAPMTDGNSSNLLAATDPAAKTANVSVSLFGFEPAVLKIDKDTTVIWTNTSTENQTIIGSSPEGRGFASPVLSNGQTYSFKFDQDATFEYYSTYNPALKATVTVGQGSVVSAPLAQSSAPATTIGQPAGAAASMATSTAPVIADSSTPGLLDQVVAAAPEATSTEPSPVEPSAAEDLKAAAPEALAETGPTDMLYLFILAAIVWFNRRKLAAVWNK